MRNCILVFALIGYPLCIPAQEIPAAAFGHLPVIEQPSVSPDGEYVAAVLNDGDVPGIVVAPFGTQDLVAILRLENADDRIEWIEWANNNRLLVSASFSAEFRNRLFRPRRMIAIDKDGQNMREIRRRVTGTVTPYRYLESNDQIISMLPDNPGNILLQLYDEADEAPAVFEVDIYNNRFRKLFANHYDVNHWRADEAGNVRLGTEIDEDGVTFWYRHDNSESFEELYSFRPFEDNEIYPVTIEGNSALVLSSLDLGRSALWRFDLETHEFEELLSVEGFDLEGVLLDSARTKVVGAYWYEHFERRTYLDEGFGQLHEVVQQTFRDYQAVVASRNLNGSRAIARIQRDDSPPKYFWLDLEKGAGGPWFSQFPDLEGQKLAIVVPFEFDARDGMRLNGYLTLPTTDRDRLPPTVVLPHGGPHARDYRHFDPMVQFLANRGYAVLQVNFRGSTGFGDNYLRAGYLQWGGAMQTDVYDAIDWLATTGKADTENACIVGASFGGYISLVAAFQYPQRFACFASLAGVTDPITMIKFDSIFPAFKLYYSKTVADLDEAEHRDMLRRRSPIENVDNIVRPMLLIHGDKDTQVRIKQSQDFFKKARKLRKNIEYIELEKGTHYFDQNSNRRAVFEALEEFLATHLR